MAQVLKEEVKNRILSAAWKKWFAKTLSKCQAHRDCRRSLDIPVAHLYLFSKQRKTVWGNCVCINFVPAFAEEEAFGRGNGIGKICVMVSEKNIFTIKRT